jgi:hypothetical protein
MRCAALACTRRFDAKHAPSLVEYLEGTPRPRAFSARAEERTRDVSSTAVS